MITVTKIGAKWCQPCKKYEPILDFIEETRDDVKVVRLDVDDHPEEVAKYVFTSIPFTIFSDGETGELLGSHAGPLGKIHLGKVLDSLIEGRSLVETRQA